MYSSQAKSRHTRCIDTSQHEPCVLRLATRTQPTATEPFSSSACFVRPLAYDCLQQGTKKASQACQKIFECLKTDCVVRFAACHTNYMLTAAKRMSRSGSQWHLPVQVQLSGIPAIPQVQMSCQCNSGSGPPQYILSPDQIILPVICHTMHQLQDLVLIHWPGAAHHALDSSAHAQLRLETWRVLEKFYTDGK